MGKFDGVLLAADFDDTLLGSDLTVCQRNQDALRYFIAEGGTFSVATGRAYSTFVEHWRKVPMNGPTVVSNGAAIYDFPNGRWICQTWLNQRTPARLAELVKVFPALEIEAYQGEETYVWNPGKYIELHGARVGLHYSCCPIEEMPTPWSKVLFEGETELLRQVQNYIHARWAGEYEVIFSNAHLLELTNQGSHKGAMVLKIAEMLHIRRENVYCVGDNENDIPMLAVSAIPFAPSNCAQVVRDWGARILSSCDEGCVADIIEILS